MCIETAQEGSLSSGDLQISGSGGYEGYTAESAA